MGTTKSKRIALSVPPEIDRILTELSDLSGMPKTALVLELIESAAPVLENALVGLRHAKAGKRESAIEAMGGMLRDAGFQLDEAQHDFFDIKKGKK